MKTYCLEATTSLAAPLEQVFPFFADAENLQVLTPTWLDFRIVESPSAMTKGATIDYRLRIRGVPLRWRSEITVWDPPHRFVDEQRKGPYRLWIHEHDFEPHEGGTRCRDRLTYAVPGGPLVHRLLVRSDLLRLFDYRRRRLIERFGRASRSGDDGIEIRPLP